LGNLSDIAGTSVGIVVTRGGHPPVHRKEGRRMSGDVAARPTGSGSALLAIVVPGLIAGTLDLTQAIYNFGWRVPLSIAGGLLGGAQAHAGGPGTYALGVALHFFIALSATAIFYGASRRLTFMTEHPLVSGLLYGMVVDNVMTLVVLPLSALHAVGPYELHDLLNGVITHMIVIGLPISYGVRYFSRK
jgi:hypothetical protein